MVWIGDRVMLVHMEGEPDMEPGMTGTVTNVIDPPINVVEVKWDNGRTLSICPDVDIFRVIER